MIMPYILKTICWMKVILDITDQCDTKINLIKYILVSDLYFVSVILLYILKDI